MFAVSEPNTNAAHSLRASDQFGLIELAGPAGLRAQFHPGGALHALRHGRLLLNQLLPGPAEDGLFRLLLRWRDTSPLGRACAPLAGPGLRFADDGTACYWAAEPPASGLSALTRFQFHPDLPAWRWHVRITNQGPTPRRLDLWLTQDLGLADEATVRNNEAYLSHYLDLQPLSDPTLGWVVCARQNQATGAGAHPWLALACQPGATAFCTDGVQFFGPDHRLTGTPVLSRVDRLPSHRVQGEFAVAGLQSPEFELPPGDAVEVSFLAWFVPDHPEATGPGDLERLRQLAADAWPALTPPSPVRGTPITAPLFAASPWLHGDQPDEAELARRFPGPRRHLETSPDGSVLSFFTGRGIHVVTRLKESTLARSHGHILRSGIPEWADGRQWGVTCYASGVFGAQAYFGNPSLARLLSVVRNPLNVARAQGQRVFVRLRNQWHQLGVPSVFVLDPRFVRWIYRHPGGVIEARVWCSPRHPASFLNLTVTEGAPLEFLVVHQLALGANEFDHPSEWRYGPDPSCALLRPGLGSLVGARQPGLRFGIAAADPEMLACLAGDGELHADLVSRQSPYLVLRSKSIARFGVVLFGIEDETGSAAPTLAALRAEFVGGEELAGPLPPPLRFDRHQEPGVGRVDEILPWFAHNAGIHFSAPHGLEQYGGGAWGVRDVCQGSVEWLLASGRTGLVRRILLEVFARQFPAGGWPQWFMFDPYREIQQVHSHGDVCFWPVKALCDYVEATGDFAVLEGRVGYANPDTLLPEGPEETCVAHCDRVIAHAESRFLPGTALINYGDGDWDDTLQPADPALRTGMASTWTIGLAYHAFRQLAVVCHRAGHSGRAARLHKLLTRMRDDFARYAMPGGVVAGFLIAGRDGTFRPLLHPADTATGIRYRLLPMTRSILAGLFTPDEAARHIAIVDRELRFIDGVRLMSEPAAYHGGRERLFKRADTAAHVGREVGLQYVHAHIRYAEALAQLGDAERLWWALQVVNPVGLAAVVPGAQLRQANVYFSSSDADFANRLEALTRWPELRAGRVPVHGGWRLYSSGPGLWLHKIRACLLGLRESFDDVVFDPVLPRCLDGLSAHTHLLGHPVRLAFAVRRGTSSPRAVRVNGHVLTGALEANPYRLGGLRVDAAMVSSLLRPADNVIEIEL
jgi:1,2-beta-oligoglucan phosphorylase